MQSPQNLFTDTGKVSRSQSPLNPTNDGSSGTSIPNLGPLLSMFLHMSLVHAHCLPCSLSHCFTCHQHTGSGTAGSYKRYLAPASSCRPQPRRQMDQWRRVVHPALVPLSHNWSYTLDDTPIVSLPDNNTSLPPESESGQCSLDPAPTIPPQEAPPAPPAHEFIQIEVIVKTSDLKVYIIKTTENGETYRRCDYPGCSHVDPFRTTKETISHIRRVHLQQRPFECTWYAHL